MPRIAGVTTQKDARGNMTHVTINLKKHKEAIPVLQQLGLIEKDQFDIDFKEGLTLDQFTEEVTAHIKSMPWKK